MILIKETITQNLVQIFFSLNLIDLETALYKLIKKLHYPRIMNKDFHIIY